MMLSLLSRWVRPRLRVNVRHLEVTVYTRAQCCCCHKALDLLEEYRRRHGFTIRFGPRIPVTLCPRREWMAEGEG